jgi:hypothetical protein
MDDMNAHVQGFSLIFNEDKKKKNSRRKIGLIFLMQELWDYW